VNRLQSYERNYVRKIVARVIEVLHKIGFYKFAQRFVSSIDMIGWRKTLLALKCKVQWMENTVERSGQFKELAEIATATVHHLKVPSIVFSDRMLDAERSFIEKRFAQHQTVRDHALKVVSGSTMRVVSDEKNVIIIDSNGNPIQGLCVAIDDTDFVMKRLLWPRSKPLRGHTLLCSAAMADDNYYHWTLEAIPRIGAVLKSGLSWEDFDQLLIRNKAHRFQVEGLEALGCPQQKVLTEPTLSCFDCEQVTTTTHPANYSPSEFAINYLTGPFADAVKSHTGYQQEQPCSEKIYISRLGSRRELANESEVIKFLLERGFSIVNLETLSLQSQIRLFEGARIVVAAHGAGLANIVYCKPDTRVIEIFHPNHVETMYWGISEMKGLDYTPFCLASHQEHMPISRLLMLASQTN
jgi:hypothetical protein